MNLESEILGLVNLAAKDIEQSILSGLQDLVSRGILVIERGAPVIIVDPENRMSVSTPIKLHLSNQEYVENLERENEKMKDIIIKLREFA